MEAQLKVEAAPNVETRGRVLNAVSNAAYRWEDKIRKMHSGINPFVEIDELQNTGVLTDQQRSQFAAFRNFQRGVRALTGAGHLSLGSLRRDTIPTSFRDLDTQETRTRDEDLNVAGLIESTREDINISTKELERTVNESRRAQLENRIQQYRDDLTVLEGNSVPYEEAFPNALDDNDMVERSRIAAEAWHITNEPLATTGSGAGDKQLAISRLRGAILLKIPPKTPTVATESKFNEYGEIEDLPPAIFSNNGSIGEEGTIYDESGFGRHSNTSFFGGIGREAKYAVQDIGDEVKDLIEDLRYKAGAQIDRLEPHIAARVERLKKIKVSDSSKKRLMIVPLVLLLLASTSRSTNPHIPSPVYSQEPKFGSPPLDVPMPEIKLERLGLDAPQPVAPTSEPVQFAETQPSSLLPPDYSVPILESEQINTPNMVDSEEPDLEIEIKQGQTVRGIIEQSLQDADSSASPSDVDEAASVVLWKVINDNPQIAENPDLVHPGDRFRIPTTLGRFMQAFKSMESGEREQLVTTLNTVEDNPDSKLGAQLTAADIYRSLINPPGGKTP